MKQLIEGMLSIGSRFAEDHRSGYIVYRLAEAVHGFSVGLHICLLQMCREAAQCLRVGKYCGAAHAQHVALIYANQGVQHSRVLQKVLLLRKHVLCSCACQEAVKYLRTEGQG